MSIEEALHDNAGEWVIEGSELAHYPQPYKPSEQDIEQAFKLEQYILSLQEDVENGFLKIGAALVEFEDRKFWLARGVPSFRAWLSGPEFHFSYEHGTRLMRVVRDLIPVLGSGGEMPNLPLSTLRELLPMLTEGFTDDEIREIAEEVKGMTTRDAKKYIQERRGVGKRKEEPVIFRARVVQGTAFHLVYITRTGGDDGDIYEVTEEGPLRVKPKDWQRWAERFGEGFVTYE